MKKGFTDKTARATDYSVAKGTVYIQETLKSDSILKCLTRRELKSGLKYKKRRTIFARCGSVSSERF